jgi:phosphoribosylaminoimidazole-succinocarboxamide synthase
MNKLKIGLLGSGQGSTIKAICDAVKCGILDLKIECIITNYNDEKNINNMNTIGEIFKIETFNLPNNIKENSREAYNKLVVKVLCQYDLDVVVLAGWNFIVNDQFINSFKLVINLHPALPNTFIGQNCIKKAYLAYQRGEIKYTGSMVHQVIDDVDKGDVLNTITVPIFDDDSYENLELRVKNAEKGMLIQTIQSLINGYNISIIEKNMNINKIYNGKVRRVEDIGYGCLLLSASNRMSAFDKHICNIWNKGVILNNISVWWFNKTKHIIDNHYLYHIDNHMIVKKTTPIKLEIVVRGYMTGSTNTSIWPMYNRGERNIYGINFRYNYSNNEKLDEIIITPTTKGINDIPITPNEIIAQHYLVEKDWKFISEKAIELFKFGQEEAAKKGLILVDTKYEFGWLNDKIILIDELHTCDSSRYWVKSSYNERFNNGLDPEKMDKDAIRDWVKQNCDPYNDPIPKIPNEVIENVEGVYNKYHKLLTNSDVDPISNINIDNLIVNYFMEYHDQIVVIIAGSLKDKNHVEKIKNYLEEYNIYSIHYYSSAHKNTKQVLSIIKDYEKQNRSVIYVTVAGKSNALSGVVASNTKFPTIACPPFKDNVDMTTNINSTLMCPSKVPVMTILEPENVAISIKNIFKLLS